MWSSCRLWQTCRAAIEYFIPLPVSPDRLHQTEPSVPVHASSPSEPFPAHIPFSRLVQIVVLMALLIRMLTWQSAMTGLGVTLGIIPFSIWVGRLQTKVRLHVVQKTDARVKLTGEVLSGEFHAVSTLKLAAVPEFWCLL